MYNKSIKLITKREKKVKLFEDKNEEEKAEKINRKDDFDHLREKYKKLIENVERHNNLYYNEDKPEISDMEYDFLVKELKKIEQEFPELKEEYKNVISYNNAEYEIPPNGRGGVTSRQFFRLTYKMLIYS